MGKAPGASQTERFWHYVNKDGPVMPGMTDKCWLWTGGLNHGYGSTTWNGRSARSHRVAYTLAVGPIPNGMLMLHNCDNPPCVNPAHLRPGTPAENMQDRDTRKRQSAGDKHYSRTSPERLARGANHGSKTRPDRVPRGEHHGVRLHPECVRRGEANPRAKLTDAMVIQIRRSAAAGEQCSSIARNYPFVSRALVSNIIHRKVWRHVVDPDAKGDSNAIVDALPV